MRIVVVGAGKVGKYIATDLHDAGHEVLVEQGAGAASEDTVEPVPERRPGRDPGQRLAQAGRVVEPISRSHARSLVERAPEGG